MTRTALVTGGNRGIGLEICRQLAGAGIDVILAARDGAAGTAAAETLQDAGARVAAQQMDVADPDSIHACADRVRRAGVAVDILVNNAGVIAEGELLGPTAAPMEDALEVNLMGPYHVARAFLPAMIERGWGRVVNVSSNWGSFARGLEGPAAYAVSKAALNALTVRLAREAGDAVKVNSMCPGWVRTRMGGDSADRPVEDGADTALFLATLPDDGPTGLFFRDRKPTEW